MLWKIVEESRTARLEALFRQQHRSLCRYVYQIVGSIDDALEIVQESFLRLWKAQGECDETCLEAAYLFRLARNVAIDALRKSQVRERYLSIQVARGNVLILPVTPEDEILRRERHELAGEALRQLTFKQRELLVLRASGFSYDEIAEIAGVSRGSVGQNITRAMRKCRLHYEELLDTHSEESRHASS